MSSSLNQLYTQPSKVNAAELEMVQSFFMSVCPSEAIANSFTAIVFRIAAYTGAPVHNVLDEFRTMTPGDMRLTEEMAYYMNTLSTTKTSMFGVSATLPPVASVNRNIIQ